MNDLPPKKTKIASTLQNRIRLILFCLGTFWCATLTSQEVERYSYSIKEGDQTYMNSNLLVDNEGFLWYATPNGVYRDFGEKRKFIPLKFTLSDDTSRVFDIFQDLNNKVWIGCDKGAYIINPKDYTYELLQWKKDKQSENSRFTAFNVRKKDSAICILSDTHLLWYNDKRIQKVIPFHEKMLKSRGTEFFYRTLRTKNNDIVVYNKNDHIFKLEEDSFKFIDNKAYFDILTDDLDLESEQKDSIIANNPTGSNYKYLSEVGMFKIYHKSMEHVSGQLLYNYLKKWVLVENTLAFIKEDSLHIQSISFSNNKLVFRDLKKVKLTNAPESIHAVKDYYILSYSDKIEKLRIKDKGYVKKYFSEFKNPISTRGIVSDSNENIYVASYSGLFKIKSENDISQIYKHEDGYKYRYPFYSLILENDSLLWASHGSYYRSYLWQLKGAKRTYFDLPENAFLIRPRNDNSIWICTYSGLYVFDKTKETYTKYKDLPLENIAIGDILETSLGNLWMGTDKGAYFFNPKTKAVISYNNSSEKYIPHNVVNDIHEDKYGNIWLAGDKGLSCIVDNQKIYNYSKKDGLSNTISCGILETQKHLWVSTYGGINRIELKDTKADVKATSLLLDVEFNRHSFHKLNDSILLFGSVDGIYEINANKVHHEEYRDELRIVSVKSKNTDKNRVEKRYENVSDIKRIDLEYDTNFFEIEYALTNTFDPTGNNYQYKVDNWVDDWVDINNESTLRLYGIPSGDYTLRISGKNDQGQLSTNQIVIPIYVSQIFYKTTWFIICSISILMLMILIIIRKNIQKKEREKHQKETIRKLKIQALRLQMNPHFIFSVVNGIQSDLVLKGEQEVNDYIQAFSKLLRKTMDMVTEEKIDLASELEYIESYIKLQKHRLDGNLNYSIKTALKNFDIQSVKIPCMLLQPLIENAIIHGLEPKKNNRELQIQFQIEEDILIVTIKDNGIGREASKRSKGSNQYKQHAHGIISNRIDLNNKISTEYINMKIEDLKNNKIAMGTEVELRINI